MSNREILAAVLVKWAEPLLSTLAGSTLINIPAISSLENKIRSTGWVSPQWSIGSELSPFVGSVVTAVAAPMLSQYLSNVPDEAIPAMAHGIVDKAIANGELSILEGNVRFDKDDLLKLKRLLNANLRPQVNEPINLNEEDEQC